MTLKALGETARFINGAAFKPTDWGSVGLPIIRIQNLTGTSDKFNLTTRQVKPELVVEQGDLLVSWSATLDVYRWKGPRGVLNQHIFKVIPNDGIEPDYLFFALKSALAELTAKTHGSTMKHVVRGDFESTKVHIPSIDEQRRMLDILIRADGIVQLCHEAQEKTAKLIPTLFIDMFGDPTTNPKRWRISKIADSLEFAYGKSLPKNSRAQNSNIPVYGSNGITGWHDQAITDKPTVIVGRKGGAGMVHYVSDACYPIDTTFYLKVRAGYQFEMLYLAIMLKIFDLSRLKTSTGVPGLSREDAYRESIPVPPIELQNKFAELVKNIFSIQSQQSTATAKAKATFDALLAQVFSS